MALDLYEALFEVVEQLEQEGIEHALVGALAVAVHGAPRATTDIDLLVIAMKAQAGRPQDIADIERLQESDR